jgi:hypothetical protein
MLAQYHKLAIVCAETVVLYDCETSEHVGQRFFKRVVVTGTMHYYKTHVVEQEA